MSFDRFQIEARLLAGVRDLEFSQPTPIQEQAIPAAMEGRDLLACAMTGSGKTAAFLLPTLHRLLALPRGKTRALVLAPTRELAAQIQEHLVALAKHTPLRSAAIFGGVGMSPQEQAFRRGVDVIIATPGRLLDHLQYPYASLADVEVLVLDEADRMLDMGFLPDIRRILRHVPAERQTLFFSATMPKAIVDLSGQMLREPFRVDLERRAAPATGVTQAVYPVSEELKAPLLVELLKRGDVGSAIVFCRTKHRANRLADYLDRHSVPNARIHGNRSQTARTDALAGFKHGRYRVLVATDIVARGIDVEALEHVINFDVPAQPEDYIHRVGRTARAEATGDAYTLYSPGEEKEMKAIERAINQRLRRVTVDGFDYGAKPTERFEVPIGERIAEIRKRKAEERERARIKAARKAERQNGDAQARPPAGRAQASPSSRASSDGGERGTRSGGRSGWGGGADNRRQDPRGRTEQGGGTAGRDDARRGSGRPAGGREGPARDDGARRPRPGGASHGGRPPRRDGAPSQRGTSAPAGRARPSGGRTEGRPAYVHRDDPRDRAED
jgi:ATP-dependent RNA helicase RhlE